MKLFLKASFGIKENFFGADSYVESGFAEVEKYFCLTENDLYFHSDLSEQDKYNLVKKIESNYKIAKFHLIEDLYEDFDEMESEPSNEFEIDNGFSLFKITLEFDVIKLNHRNWTYKGGNEEDYEYGGVKNLRILKIEMYE